jgi:hypothetical protein
MRPTLLLLALFTGLCAAQDKPAPEAQQEPPKEEKKEDKKVEPVTKDGSVTIGGKKIDYQVTTAKLTLQKDDGAPRASVFHVSYLKKNAGDLSKYGFTSARSARSGWICRAMAPARPCHRPGWCRMNFRFWTWPISSSSIR